MNKGLHEILSNEQYHSDNGYYSSSQLKDALKSEEVFYNKHILKTIERKHSAAFDIGTAFHTLVLEPHLYDQEILVSPKPSNVRHLHPDKTVITPLQERQVRSLASRVQQEKLAEKYLQGGQSEVSLFTELDGLDVKVRADYLNINDGFIQDLKTTSGDLSENSLKKKVAMFDYDLSAAFYIDCFNAYYGEEKIKEFIWIFASKDHSQVKVARASKLMIENGRAKYKKAIEIIKQITSKEWKYEEKVLDLDPLDSDLVIDRNLGGW